MISIVRSNFFMAHVCHINIIDENRRHFLVIKGQCFLIKLAKQVFLLGKVLNEGFLSDDRFLVFLYVLNESAGKSILVIHHLFDRW